MLADEALAIMDSGENAHEISRRAVDYFGCTLRLPLRVASWRGRSDEVLAREQALALAVGANLVFAGPGSPTYALRVWRDRGLREVLADKLAFGGCVTFGSAAAACLGIAAVPAYEIYKVGTDPHWVQGLDLLSVIGMRAAVIPHYDNAEGGTHDTRFCYLGERRRWSKPSSTGRPTPRKRTAQTHPEPCCGG